MKNQNFGIEIEITGITRSTAAKVIASYFHTDATHVGGCYDAYSVRDNDGRMWKIMRDASVRCENRSGQNASSLYSVEFVTPICNNYTGACQKASWRRSESQLKLWFALPY